VAQNHLKRASRVAEQNFSRWTYGELKRHVDAIATGFHGLKLSKGDKMALALPNNAECIVSMLAAAKLGVVIVPLPAQPTATQIEETLASGVSALIFSDSEGGTNYSGLIQSIVPETTEFGRVGMQGFPFRSKKFPQLRYLVNTGRYRAPGMTRFQWIGTYGFDNTTQLKTVGYQVVPSDVFIQIGTKTVTHGEVVKAAQDYLSHINAALPLPSTATFVTALPFCASPSVFAAGVVAPQLAGAMAVFSQGTGKEHIEGMISVDQPEVLVADQNALSVAQEYAKAHPSHTIKHAIIVGSGSADAAKASLGLSSTKVVP